MITNFKTFSLLILLIATGIIAPLQFIYSDDSNSDDDTELRTILFLGNSLSAGYGLDPQEAFPARIEAKIDSLDWAFKVVNAGLSGETTSGGLRRINWLLKQKVDVLVIELGGNDGLRGIPVDLTEKNLQGIIDKARKKHPDMTIVLAGMEVPPNMGDDYAAKFRKIYPGIAKANSVTLIPFLLEGVGGVPELNLPDQIHPTAEGHKLVAENVWTYLAPVLKQLLGEN
ncbi:MAG: arylesterase [Calditrichia bacterium]